MTRALMEIGGVCKEGFSFSGFQLGVEQEITGAPKILLEERRGKVKGRM